MKSSAPTPTPCTRPHFPRHGECRCCGRVVSGLPVIRHDQGRAPLLRGHRGRRGVSALLDRGLLRVNFLLAKAVCSMLAPHNPCCFPDVSSLCVSVPAHNTHTLSLSVLSLALTLCLTVCRWTRPLLQYYSPSVVACPHMCRCACVGAWAGTRSFCWAVSHTRTISRGRFETCSAGCWCQTLVRAQPGTSVPPSCSCFVSDLPSCTVTRGNQQASPHFALTSATWC